jgi:hypothetical protein
MTPQELEIEERAEKHLSTADLAQSAANPSGAPAAARPHASEAEPNAPLFATNDTQDFRSRWEKIQIGFVDEPRKAVEQADELVASAIKRLAEVFASERQKLEAEWDKNDNVSTEDLRVALRRYRSFFDRLLSV